MSIRLATSTIDSPSKYTQTYETFRGVDLTHSKIEVESYRATDMRNFIMENESNTKRFGWEEMYRFSSEDNQINGIWTLDSSYPITDDKGNILSYVKDSIIIVQVDKKFYKIKDFGIEVETNSSIVNKLDSLNNNIIEIPFAEGADIYVKNQKSEAFVRGNRLYILCGDLLVLGKWSIDGKWTGEEPYEIRRVYDDEDTYIPTLTTKIVCENSSYLTATDTFTTNVALDDRNMMSSKVKVQLLGEPEDSPNQNNVKYILNIGFAIESIESIVANGEIVTDYTFDNDTNTLILTNNYVPTLAGVDNIIVTLIYTNPSKNIIRECTFGIIYGYNGLRDRLFVSGNEDYPNMLWHSTETNETNESEESDFTYFSDVDYIKLGNTNNSIMGMYIQGDGSLVVLKSPSSQEPTIYFINATMVSATDYTGAIVVGLDGNTLYEESYPVQIGSIGVGLKKRNGIYNLNGDPLMISDNGIYGIVLGDNVASQQRYAKLRSRLIDNAITNISDLENTACICYKNKFFIADTSTGLCYIADSRYPCQLNDDLSDTYQYEWWIWDGIYARIFFEYKEELYFATQNGQICKLKNQNYKDVSYRKIGEGSIAYDKEKDLFLLNKDNEILNFQTWAEYEKLHEEDRLNFNDNLNIKVLIENKDNLYIDEDSYICYSANISDDEIYEKYKDLKTTLFLLECQGITIKNDEYDLSNVYLIYVDEINELVNTKVSLNTRYVIRNVTSYEEDGEIFTLKFRLATLDQALESVLPEYGYIKFNMTGKDRIDNPFRLSTNMPLDLVIDSLQTVDGLLYEKTFKGTDGYWYYYDDNNNVISLNTTERPEFNYFKLEALEFNNKSVKVIEYEDSPLLDFYEVEVPAVLTLNQQIEAFYTTTWYNLGTDVYLKNLLSVYVVPDPVASNKVEFAFETRRKDSSYQSYTGKTFDFNDLDFNDVSFTSNQIPTVYQKKFKTKKFSYIRFIFKNSDNNNCKLARVTIEYTIGTRVKGEK
ncbi:MAG: hypothetical protein ACI4WW_02610 [Candidatus Coprovivens sp.]